MMGTTRPVFIYHGQDHLGDDSGMIKKRRYIPHGHMLIHFTIICLPCGVFECLAELGLRALVSCSIRVSLVGRLVRLIGGAYIYLEISTSLLPLARIITMHKT